MWLPRPYVAGPTLPVTLDPDIPSLLHFLKLSELVPATRSLHLLFPFPGKPFQPLSLCGLLHSSF